MLCNLGRQQVVTPGVNKKMVKMVAPDLFPVISLLNKQFIPTAITSRRAFVLAGSKSAKPLKIKGLSWL